MVRAVQLHSRTKLVDAAFIERVRADPTWKRESVKRRKQEQKALADTAVLNGSSMKTSRNIQAQRMQVGH